MARLGVAAPISSEMRYSDFKSSWALSLEDLRLAEARAMEALVEVTNLYDKIVQSTEGIAQDMRNSTIAATVLYAQIKDSMQDASRLNAEAARLFMQLANSMGGLDEHVREKFFGECGVVPELERELTGHHGVAAVMAERLTGIHGVSAVVTEKLVGRNGVVSKLDSRLNGEAGVLRKSEQRITKSTAALVSSVDAATKLIGSFRTMLLTHGVAHALGVCLGGALVAATKFI